MKLSIINMQLKIARLSIISSQLIAMQHIQVLIHNLTKPYQQLSVYIAKFDFIARGKTQLDFISKKSR